MNTEYQIVAAGTISPLNTDTADSTDQGELLQYQKARDERLERILTSKVMVEITTEYPSYESLSEGAWRHELLERIYQAVVARATKRLEHINPRRFACLPKSASVNLAWERLHHNDSGKPVYSQRWYIEKDHAALLGYPGRLGEESFADIIIATWHAGTADAEAQRGTKI
ncbi:hypothetical protein [Marinimicrobium sp. LS-A18]|uniref:hypothetical protein n=1 Tax=Marinimicrobium sp. LS-A18 TaxID=1381596 RepID=UPI0004650165|nr:hypothetical protein [Marinimicrobium sp. LS-A18]